MFGATRIPFITRNVSQAWIQGQPGVLTMNRPMQGPNRTAACGTFKKTVQDGSCDEYPVRHEALCYRAEVKAFVHFLS